MKPPLQHKLYRWVVARIVAADERPHKTLYYSCIAKIVFHFEIFSSLHKCAAEREDSISGYFQSRGGLITYNKYCLAWCDCLRTLLNKCGRPCYRRSIIIVVSRLSPANKRYIIFSKQIVFASRQIEIISIVAIISKLGIIYHNRLYQCLLNRWANFRFSLWLYVKVIITASWNRRVTYRVERSPSSSFSAVMNLIFIDISGKISYLSTVNGGFNTASMNVSHIMHHFQLLNKYAALSFQA